MENIGGIFLVFLNVVTPVFILVVIGNFVGPRLKLKHVHFQEQPILCSFRHLYLILSVRRKLILG